MVDDKQALDRFEQRLLDAKELLDSGDEYSRASAIVAVLATIELIRKRLGRQNFETPLVLLLGALTDLELGIQSPLITPKTFANRHPDGIIAEMVHGTAAGTMEILMKRVGLRRSEAAQEVALVLTKAGFPVGQSKKGKPAGTVASWRDRINGQRPRAIEADYYERLLARQSVVDCTDYAALRCNLLNGLEDMAGMAASIISK